MSNYFDKLGRPIDMFEWTRLHGDREYMVIGSNELPATSRSPASRLSTVWLGLNHNFFSDSPPIIFETMRFGAEEESGHHPVLEFPHPDDGELTEQVRYCTEEQASRGHEAIMRRIQETEMI